MKRTVPLFLTSFVGFVLVCSAFVPAAESWGEETLIWFNILASIAFVLGGASLCGSQLKKISTRRKGWGYAAVTLLAFFITLAVGLLKLGVRPVPNQEYFGESFASLPVSALPATTFDVAVPDDLRAEPLPASIRRQVTLTETGLRVAGWLTPGQIADLSDAHPTLDWQCAISRLPDVAVPPPAFRRRLNYRPDHRVLAFRGVMTESDASELKGLPDASVEFQRAIDELADKSSRKHSVAGASPPPGFEFPSSLQAKATIADGSIQWTGPMSPGEREQLASGSLRSRIAFPLSPTEREQFLAQLAGGRAPAEPANAETARFPLTDEERDRLRQLVKDGQKLSAGQTAALSQQTLFDQIVSKNWAEDLVLALNTAGVPEPGTKTACELVAERERGVTDLDPVIPPGEKVELTDAQKQAIAAFTAPGARDWAQLESALRDSGPFTAGQAGALDGFRQDLPTIGQRDRRLFDELVKAGPLTPSQRELLLKEYQVERNWQAIVGRLFFASHEIKYPWSGEFNQQGSPFWWLFEYVFQPLQSMMFALLAFYVASAAFRAFRAKNIEAILLLGTAFIILLGRTYIGSLATAWLPRESPLRLENLSVDIMRVFNSAGNRAIMIGIALGLASTSLKVLLGIDRSHIGGKD